MPQNNPQRPIPPKVLKTPVVPSPPSSPPSSPPPSPPPPTESPDAIQEENRHRNHMLWLKELDKGIGSLKWLLVAILLVNITTCVNTCSTDSAVRAERIIRPIR